MELDWSKNNSFEKQLLQHFAALYYKVPIREVKLEIYDFLHSKLKIKESQNKFYNHIYKNLTDIENFDKDFFEELYGKCILQESSLHNVFETYYSNVPNLFRELNNSKKFYFYLLLIFALLAYRSKKIKRYQDISILSSFEIKSFRLKDRLYLIGPIKYKDKMFNFNIFEKIKYIFDLDIQLYKIRSLYESIYNQENIDIENGLERYFSRASDLLESIKDAKYSKNELKNIATHIIVDNKFSSKNINIYSSSERHRETANIIDIRRKERDTLYINYFNNILYEKGSFGGFEDLKEFSKIMKRLSKNINADYVIYYQYNKSSESEKLESQVFSNISKEERNELNKVIYRLNNDDETFENSLTYKIINKFNKKKEATTLLYNSKDKLSIQPFGGVTTIESLLSFTLVFDNDIRGIMHFISKRANSFNKEDKDFIYKILKPVTYQIVHSRFFEDLKSITNEQNRLITEDVRQNFDKLFYTIFNNISIRICSMLSADASSIWFNKREILQDIRSEDNIKLIASHNIFKNEKNGYSVDNNAYIVKQNNEDIISIKDIENETSSYIEDKNYLKYRTELLKSGYKSMFVHILKKHNRTIGAIVIFNKDKKRYSEVSFRMLKIIANQINAILATLEHIVYKNKRISEKSFHDSSKFLTMIDNATSRLLYRLKEHYIRDSKLRHHINYNIQDIKNYSSIARKFLDALIEGKEFKRNEDVLLEFQKKLLETNESNGRTVNIRDIITAILQNYEEKLNVKNITYYNPWSNNIEVKLEWSVVNTVFLNMIDNAYKYSKPNSKLKIYSQKNKNGYYFYIENIGYKIDTYDKANIFKKGQRAYIVSNSTKEEFKEKGSENKGLGLYYVSELTKLWGGSIDLIESKAIDNIYSIIKFRILIPYYKIKDFNGK